ncbi:hypothetical protein [Streptomyces acidicola]|uniref:hypothetical protein n=1 Tax=Streptomyces acidicola TaxID=2596892 RepID=UPI0037F7943B
MRATPGRRPDWLTVARVQGFLLNAAGPGVLGAPEGVFLDYERVRYAPSPFKGVARGPAAPSLSGRRS